MTNLNDGNGLFDKYGLIDGIICDLDKIEVKGAGNMVIVINTIQKLSALRKALKDEEKAKEVDNGFDNAV